MLHLTSFVQNIAKLNGSSKPINVNTNPQSVLNGLNRNYSFIYDHNLKRYDYHFEENDEDDDDFYSDTFREGYWGYMRDRNADRKQINKKLENNHDGYWGFFKDNNDITRMEALSTDTTTNTDDINSLNELSSPFSASPSILSMSSSINSLSRFKDMDLNDENEINQQHMRYNMSNSFFDRYEKKLEYDYNYKTSKLKIQACKRDEMKILMQSLEDQESNFKKEIIKSFDSKCLNIITNDTSQQNGALSLSPSLTYSTKAKNINFLHFSNKSVEDIYNTDNNLNNFGNLNNFKNIFNTLTKLKKSINIFSGDFLNLNRADLFLSFINNVHASMNDVNGFLFNYLYENNKYIDDNKSVDQLQRQTTNVSLCSNMYETLNSGTHNDINEKTQKIFGHGNHSTMLFEYQNIKIGFMALIDNSIFEKLTHNIDDSLKKNLQENENNIPLKDDLKNGKNSNSIEYIDYLSECDKLSKQLRMCGANLIVVLTNMSDSNEQKLIREASDLDIIFSSLQNDLSSGTDMKNIQINNRYLIKSGSHFDCISLISLNLDELNSNKILDIAITKYLVE